MSDPLREIEELEADPESWWLTYRNAIAFQEQVEREHGTAVQRMARRPGAAERERESQARYGITVVPARSVVRPPRWRHG